MRPLLFEIPLPALRLSLWPALLGAAVVVGLLAFLTFRQAPAGERRGLLFPGAVVAALLVGAFLYRDRALVVGSIEVGGFGAMLALSLGVGVWLTQRAAERRGLSRADSASVCAVAAVSGIVGARVGYALLHPSELGSVLGVLAFFDGGLVAHGALAFGVVAAFVASRRRGLLPLGWLDAASTGLALGVVLTRVGCWLEGCDFGRVLGDGAPRFLARLGTFPAGSPAWVEQVTTQALPASAPAALPVHPAQLYEALGGGAARRARALGGAEKASSWRYGAHGACRVRAAAGARRFHAGAVARGVARACRGGWRSGGGARADSRAAHG
jgi:phosphatidylglycerol:prolipoprotein diacylglycerol transferase